jgi:CubicO group peptidase (beta-lactamase class C family)
MSEADALAALREDLEKAAAADQFSGAVLVAKNGKELFSKAYGLADRENEVANTVETLFRIGSMNKMFTATSVLQLVQLGKIKLTDPLGKHVADYPNQEVATKVTIHHLLTHTGGTGDIFGPMYEVHRRELRTLDDYVALYGHRPPAFEPGSEWAYSNYGMVLLGVVIERVSGMSYYDYVAKYVYEPAGMDLSGSEPESDVVRERSIGYTRPRGGGGWTPNTDTLPYRGTSAGGGYSTVGDLMKFAHALLGHRLLNAEHTEMLITGKVDSAGGRRYAYGFEDGRNKDGAGAVGHGGGAPGMNGDLKIYPQSGYVVAVLSNLDPPAAQRVSTFLDARLPE